MQQTTGRTEESYFDPALFDGDVAIVWSGNDFTEWGPNPKRWMVAKDLPPAKRNDIELFSSYLAQFKNPLVIGFGCDENWNLEEFNNIAYSEGAIPLLQRNIPIVNPKHSYGLLEHRTGKKSKERDDFRFASVSRTTNSVAKCLPTSLVAGTWYGA